MQKLPHAVQPRALWGDGGKSCTGTYRIQEVSKQSLPSNIQGGEEFLLRYVLAPLKICIGKMLDLGWGVLNIGRGLYETGDGIIS